MKLLAFVLVAIFGAAIGQEIDTGAVRPGDDVTIELYRGGVNKGRMWPVENGRFNAAYDRCKQPIFFATGYTFGQNRLLGRDNYFVTTIATSVSNFSDYNVFVVNYNNSHYLTAPAIAAPQIAEFLEALSATYNVQGEDVIFVGYSLGAQLAGLTSQIFRIGTIFAFDTVGPYFDDISAELRLDRSDTDFLVAVHTSDLVGTLKNDMGHVNLFLDGGLFPHGCPDTDLVCFTARGLDVIMSMSTACNMVFTQCVDYRAYKEGDCDGNPTMDLKFDIDFYDPDTPMDGRKYYYDTPNNVPRLGLLCRPTEMGPVSFESRRLCRSGWFGKK